MKILKIRNRIFDLDGEFVEEFSVIGPNHTGMSGCVYGPKLPYVGELYHITMHGSVEINAPVLLKKEFTGGQKAGTEAYANIDLQQIAAMILQLHMDGEYVPPILEELPFIMAKKMVIPFLISAEVELMPGVKYYRKWPETRLIVGNLSISAPTTSIKKINVHQNYLFRLPVIKLGNTNFLIARPDGRGTIVYKFDSLYHRMMGWEYFEGYKHPECEIRLPGKIFSDPFWKIIGLLINQRIGDIIFCNEETATELHLFPYEDWNQNKKIFVKTNIVIHEEHGMIKISDKWKAYHVPYQQRGHD